MSRGEAPPPPPPAGGPDGDPGRDAEAPLDGHDGTARDGAGPVSPLARRVGPVVAAIGLLGVVVTVAWIGLAPDNVVGTVADAGITVPATAVAATAREADGDLDGETCLRVVEGDGGDRRLCPEVGLLDPGGVWWSEDGRLVVASRDGEYLLDPTTGAADGPATEGQSFPPDTGFREDVHTDGPVVRRGPWGSDGPVVLDLGGPVGRLDVAVSSPDGQWVVAVDRDGRVLVAEASRPTEVHVWFEVPEDRWFDPWTAVRWEE